HQPLYTFACAGTLALAVAAATASFAVVKPSFLDPLPYAGGDALVSIYTNTETWATAPVSARVMEEIEASGAPITGIAGIDPEGVAYATSQSNEQVLGLRVTPEFFSTIAAPAAGRGFSEGDRDVAILSWSFAQRAFDGDPAAIGRSIMLDGTAHTVVGVMRQGFAAPYWPNAEVLRPLDLAGLLATRPRAVLDLTVIARLNDGATQAQLDAHLAAFSGRLQSDYPEIHGRESWVAHPLRDELVGSARPALLGTAAAAVLLLLIVLANIAGLSAALAVTMRHRLAVQARRTAGPAAERARRDGRRAHERGPLRARRAPGRARQRARHRFASSRTSFSSWNASRTSRALPRPSVCR
ncbi:MAG: ABC transporter permease, partial [Longimicrobiales bacterium]